MYLATFFCSKNILFMTNTVTDSLRKDLEGLDLVIKALYSCVLHCLKRMWIKFGKESWGMDFNWGLIVIELGEDYKLRLPRI